MVGVGSRRQCIGVEVVECGCHFLYDRIKGLIISSYCMILQCNLVGLLTAKDQGIAVELLWTLVVKFSLWRPLQCLERGTNI
ncbi:unnamed protein product [Sphagnum troendelagicum]|uniref:Uncharacterized protein n=1 Tax=Sphagnum troendelagicum TaxID=128251 RepID=A0ABP0V2H2_9BRYO